MDEDDQDQDGSEADVSTCSEDDSGVWVSDWINWFPCQTDQKRQSQRHLCIQLSTYK